MNKSPYYRQVGREVEVFEQSYKNKIPFLLKGPTGTGKSRFIEFMASQLDTKLNYHCLPRRNFLYRSNWEIHH